MNEANFCLVDTHCHLDFNVFDESREAVVEASKEAGVKRIVNPGVDLESSRRVVDLADKWDLVYAAIGVHPNDAESWTDNTVRELRSIAEHPKVVAIGEIGLDYYWKKTTPSFQKRVLRSQLELAAELNLPVILHSRDSNSDLLDMVSDWFVELGTIGSALVHHPGVLHSFSGNEAEANRAFGSNFFIGIGGPLTFRNAPQLQALVSQVPLDRLLIETDAPFLSPHPYRGKRNEPARVRLVAEKMAALKQMSVEEIALRTTENAKLLFGWREVF